MRLKKMIHSPCRDASSSRCPASANFEAPMIFEARPLEGLLIVKPEKRHDERGYFSRLWCDREFPAAGGVAFVPRQISASYNAAAGTLRGMHWQAEPHGEAKLVRATRGAVFDVAVDL